jgi:STAS-like domain of unknown function (DUF4325)
MMIISVFETLNSPNAMFHQDGLKIYGAIKEALNHGDNKIAVDFSKINVLTTQFMNASLGKLIMEKGLPYFHKYVQSIGTDNLSTYNSKLNWVVDNIKNNENYRPILDIALS